MFTAKQIQKLLHARPFRPFRICMTDGEQVEILHPEIAFLTANFVEVGADLNSDGFAQYVNRYAFIHMVRVEELTAAKPS